MKQSYSFKHWTLTLLLAPILLSLYDYILTSESDIIRDFFEMYGLMLFYSAMFSFPAFIVHNLILSTLIYKHSKPGITKMILITWTIVGIVATLYILDSSFDMAIMLSYISSAIITGIALRILKRTNADIYSAKSD